MAVHFPFFQPPTNLIFGLAILMVTICDDIVGKKLGITFTNFNIISNSDCFIVGTVIFYFLELLYYNHSSYQHQPWFCACCCHDRRQCASSGPCTSQDYSHESIPVHGSVGEPFKVATFCTCANYPLSEFPTKGPIKPASENSDGEPSTSQPQGESIGSTLIQDMTPIHTQR